MVAGLKAECVLRKENYAGSDPTSDKRVCAYVLTNCCRRYDIPS
jgi:hypothetical protein